MQEQRPTYAALLDRVIVVAASGAALLSLLILLFNVLTHFPFFDETVHVHYLWQLSVGMRPGPDFLCVYPVLGYLLTMPFLRIFPESAFVLLALRCFSVVLVVLMGLVFYHHGRRISRDWTPTLLAFLLIIKASALGTFLAEYSIDHMAALAALAAFLVLFSEPRPLSIAAASALALLSVAITPKYPLPLFFGILGYVAAYAVDRRKIGKALAAAGAGGAAAATAIVLVYAITGTSLVENIRHSYLVQYRWSLRNAAFGLHTGFNPLIVAVLAFFKRNPVAGIAIAAGIAGWARRSWRNPDAAALSGAGILVGMVLSSFLIKDFHSQYVAPRVLGLVFFVPFIASLLRAPRSTAALRLVFAVAALVTLTFRIGSVAQGFDEVPLNMRGVTPMHTRYLGPPTMAPIGILALSDYDELLDSIPVNERVAAVWPFHPIFRRDQTAIAFDERPSYVFSLAPDDPVRQEFDPRSFRASMENSPPALISPIEMEYNYPPGWREAAQDFLKAHSDLYVKRRTKLFQYYLRRDLVGG